MVPILRFRYAKGQNLFRRSEKSMAKRGYPTAPL